MKFSFNWLAELVDGLDADAHEVSRLITMKTAESEGVHAELGLTPDSVIEIDNKSLTHRPDLWGHHGMAREVSAIFRKPLLDPVDLSLLPGGAVGIQVRIEDNALCPRYSALVFENVKVGPSPLWLQYRLETVGLNPINNVVDVTNYVMAELAQPMHAFDADKLHGDTIYVRCALPGERLVALNDETYELAAAHLVIGDGAGPIALAGIIGGLDSAIGEGTTRIVLESANFNASNVRKTSSALRLRTDASMRFEKAQDPVNTVRALARAVQLLRDVCPGIRCVAGLADAGGVNDPLPPIDLSLDWLSRKLGTAVPEAEVVSILESLEFGVERAAAGLLSVSVPSFRATKDVAVREDLVEEVGRMIGYGSITPAAPVSPLRVPARNAERMWFRSIRELAAARGFTEVYNYSFMSEESARTFGSPPDELLRVENPIAAGQNYMRPSLVPGIWQNVKENSKYLTGFRIFEIGREIHPGAERTHFVAAVFQKADGLEHLGALQDLAASLAPGVRSEVAAPRAFEHPHRVSELRLAGATIGRLFELHPALLKSGRAAILDLDLDQLSVGALAVRKYQPVRRFPSISFDLSFVVPGREAVGSVLEALNRIAGPEIDSVEFLADYTLPDGQRSLSFRFTVSAPDRTLSSEEALKHRDRIQDSMVTYDILIRLSQ